MCAYRIANDLYPQVSLKGEKCDDSSIPIVERLRLLTTLNVSGCSINDQGADMIAAIVLETVSLVNLDLSNTTLNTSNCTKINDSLMKISTLKLLKINNNDIDDGAANSITAVISSNHLIEKVDFSHNRLSYTGVVNITNALPESINTLDISHNFIKSDDMVDLATALSKCPVLQLLNMSHNMLNISNVLTVARYFRHHPTLQTLDMTNSISFASACELVVDVILSVNQALIYLDVCGLNIRPRYTEDYLSPPSCDNDSPMHIIQNLYSLQYSSLDIQTNVVKVTEICPISSDDIISYYVNHLGAVFCNQKHNFAIVIPPGAVLHGQCVEIQATANCFGPYAIPDGFCPISSYFWISADYLFNVPVYFVMTHYAKVRSLKDVTSLHVLQSSGYDRGATNDNEMMSPLTDGVYFDMEIGFCVLATNHFCSYCQAKSNQDIPDHLLACYYTYDESSSGSHIAEVCFCPSNSECKKVTNVLSQYYMLMLHMDTT